jgi:hypothetical protein
MPFKKILTGTFTNGSALTYKLFDQKIINGLTFSDGMTLWYPTQKLNPFYNDLSCYYDLKTNKFGYINRKGDVIVQPKYLSASDFSDERAFCFDGDNLFLMDTEFNVIKKFDGSLITMDLFHDGLCRVSTIDAEHSDLRMDGFIDFKGDFVLPLQYPCLITVPTIYDRDDLYSDGLLRIWKDDKYGYIDIFGNNVIPPVYSTASCFSNGFAAVSIDGKIGFINKKNDFIYSEESEGIRGFSEGLAAFKVNGLWGYIDTEGVCVIDPMFISVGYFKNGMAHVRTKEGAGLTGKDMKIIVKPQYDSIEVFQDGICRIVKQGKEGFLDKHGNELLEDQTTIQKFVECN